MLLCICCEWGALKVGALDALGNIASEIDILDPYVDPTTSMLVTAVCQGVESNDRAVILRSMEVLNQLAMNSVNEEFLCRNIPCDVYRTVSNSILGRCQ